MPIDLTEHWSSQSSLWPAIVLGFPQPEESRPPAGDGPPWLAWDQHQHGGLACLQAVWIGAMLPLEANLDHGHADARVVLEALRVLAHELPRGASITDPDAHDLAIGPARVDDSTRVDERLLAQLARYGALHDLGAPRALLVWENSD